MNFADRLIKSIEDNKSFIIAGFDPQLESFPKFILEQACAKESAQDGAVFHALVDFHVLALSALSGKIAAVKPNIAFFEQYGLSGLKAFAKICGMVKDAGLPVVADVKRGDIGSTAKAYSSAFLGQSNIFGKRAKIFDCDAITVNPYLGFDTVETYFDDCREFGKGLFVLVKTSNPGSASIQGLRRADNQNSVADCVANWLAEKSEALLGSSGYSGLGAVVGATYPDEARQLRKLMPNNFFLIPGMGAQGGSAQDAVAGFSAKKSGAIINMSRGLLGGLEKSESPQALIEAINGRIQKFNAEVGAALA